MPSPAEESLAREEFERNAEAIVGCQISRVTYHDGSFMEGVAWDYGDWHHVSDTVELLTDLGPFIITCTSTFYPYGIELLSGALFDTDPPPDWASRRVETHPTWTRLLTSPVRAVSMHWETFTLRPFPPKRSGWRSFGGRTTESHVVPIATRLDFDAGPVWLVAAMPPYEDGTVMAGGDEVLVAFTAERLRAFGFPDTAFTA